MKTSLIFASFLGFFSLCRAISDSSMEGESNLLDRQTETAEELTDLTDTSNKRDLSENFGFFQALEHELEARGKKEKGGGMHKMYMMFMMCKSGISTLLMLVSPILQMKAFGLSAIGILIQLARFVMQLKESKGGGGSVWGGGGGWDENDRTGAPLRTHVLSQQYSPNFIHRYHPKS